MFLMQPRNTALVNVRNNELVLCWEYCYSLQFRYSVTETKLLNVYIFLILVFHFYENLVKVKVKNQKEINKTPLYTHYTHIIHTGLEFKFL